MKSLLGDTSYAWPAGPWVRANFVSTVDGAAQGPDGRSGTINNEADVALFQQLRSTADVILVGAGTARTEKYGPVGKPIVVLAHGFPEDLAWATIASGEPRAVVTGLFEDGYQHVLVEGGPHVLRQLLEAGVVDEVCTTTTPMLIAGDHLRITAGEPLSVDVTLASLAESDGTLFARWLVNR
ncbi:MAG TPA: dihydrofolate reductase family protein [Nocardioides sp.]|nr:dihydrofolate reductase family protein [Nocardioides sp.]